MDSKRQSLSIPDAVALLARVVAIGLSLFQLYTAAFGIYRSPVAHRAVHVGLILVLYFLSEAIAKRGRGRLVFNVSLVAVAAAVTVYLVVSDQRIQQLIGMVEPGILDNLIGAVIILLVLEALRRTQFEIWVLSVISIAYMWLGSYIPGIFGHPGMSWNRIIYFLGLSSEGIFGSMVDVSSTFLYLFILLGSFLYFTGCTEFFVNLGLRLLGKQPGGPAKVSILGSGLVGMVMGSGIANVATTGVFTIPLMKKVGISSKFAGAVESVAADGGQIMPPILGTSAFLMAEFTGIPYAKIAVAAIIPGVLYYLSAYAGVHFYATQKRISGVEDEMIPSWRQVALQIYLLLPVAALMYYIFILRATPTRAGLIGIGASLLVALIRKTQRLKFSDVLQALERGAKSAIEIVIVCAGMGIFVAAVVTTGLAMRITEVIMSLSAGNLILGLIVAMIASMILGAGLPTPATYMVSAAFVAPAMMQLGVPLLAAHLFLVHFAIKSSISPPVAVTCVVAAGIAETNWWGVAWESMRLAASSFLIPFAFVLQPGLLGQGPAAGVLISTIAAAIAVVFVAAGLQGNLLRPMTVLTRVLAVIGGVLLLFGSPLTYSVGLALLVLTVLIQVTQRAKGTTAIAQ
ncbi:MAG TPA: TRAP transporter fused permease subunit [Bacillota bacterium]